MPPFEIIFWILSLCIVASAFPFRVAEIKEAFEPQDMLCSSEFQEIKGSYSKLFQGLTGVGLPKTTPDSSRKSYTGFKFIRSFNLQLPSLILNNSLKVVLCKSGKVQWEFTRPLTQDIDWAKPMCFYTPGEKMPVRKGKKWSTWFKKEGSGIRSIYPVSLKEQASNDLSHFNCYKLARRKKYTARKVSLFFPGSWVGGMFYCQITDEIKKNVIDSMDENLEFKDTNDFGICKIENSIPLFPLESDDYSKSWVVHERPKIRSFQNKLKGRFQVTKLIPYLFTANNPFDVTNFMGSNLSIATITNNSWQRPLREQLLNTAQNSKNFPKASDQWYKEIEVEEKYQMSTEELSKLDSLTDRTINRIAEIANGPNSTIKYFFSAANLGLSSNQNKKRLKGFLRKIEARIWNRFSFQDKSIATISDNQWELRGMRNQWENLKIIPEKHNYTLLENKLDR
ncbi:hypothetical protein HG535_0B01090 [Zygotorulaspora mrakii]|uniref:Uncharacterized protein n=1 Tax=Zygotorulaspora mrakii TaxID=42260 RepID=A0A7H9AXQ3_ZYGMR|nr:uncharacterized protein HG535_0B01090 [Zygotorulaspora mrakii]QLG71071.1 hypothetical protein HG535_0B01090 [Zygotorulaspora mrakii]